MIIYFKLQFVVTSVAKMLWNAYYPLVTRLMRRGNRMWEGASHTSAVQFIQPGLPLLNLYYPLFAYILKVPGKALLSLLLYVYVEFPCYMFLLNGEAIINLFLILKECMLKQYSYSSSKVNCLAL